MVVYFYNFPKKTTVKQTFFIKDPLTELNLRVFDSSNRLLLATDIKIAITIK